MFLTGFAAACKGGADEPPTRVRVTITHQPKDTTRLALPGAMRLCWGGRSLMLEALTPTGNGALLRVRYGDSLKSGSYPIRTPGDTTTPGVVGALRYQVRDVPHAFSLDSGGVDIQRAGTTAISARARAAGLDNAVRVHAVLEFQDIPFGHDTVPCGDLP